MKPENSIMYLRTFTCMYIFPKLNIHANKMEECVHMAWTALLPTKQVFPGTSRGITPERIMW